MRRGQGQRLDSCVYAGITAVPTVLGSSIDLLDKVICLALVCEGETDEIVLGKNKKRSIVSIMASLAASPALTSPSKVWKKLRS